MFKTPSVKYVVLEYGPQLYAATQYDHRFSNNKIETQEMVSEVDYRMLRRMLVTILQHQNPTSIVYRTPANWWEMLKRDHAPAWFKQKFPVREFVERVEIKDLHPLPEVRLPKDIGPMVRYAVLEDPVCNWVED